MHSERGNKEFCSLKYMLQNVNKEIKRLERKKKMLQAKRSRFVLCEQCAKHFKKDILYLSKIPVALDPADELNSPVGYHWICPYCNTMQISHYETSLNKNDWNNNDW